MHKVSNGVAEVPLVKLGTAQCHVCSTSMQCNGRVCVFGIASGGACSYSQFRCSYTCRSAISGATRRVVPAQHHGCRARTPQPRTTTDVAAACVRAAQLAASAAFVCACRVGHIALAVCVWVCVCKQPSCEGLILKSHTPSMLLLRRLNTQQQQRALLLVVHVAAVGQRSRWCHQLGLFIVWECRQMPFDRRMVVNEWLTRSCAVGCTFMIKCRKEGLSFACECRHMPCAAAAMEAFSWCERVWRVAALHHQAAACTMPHPMMYHRVHDAASCPHAFLACHQ